MKQPQLHYAVELERRRAKIRTRAHIFFSPPIASLQMQEREKEGNEVIATTSQDAAKSVEAVLFCLREVFLLCTICTQR